MELIDYINAIRRRWYVPAALVVVAVVAVLVTTPDSSEPSRPTGLRFTAVHTLVSDGSGDGGSANLDRTAFLVTVGDIPARVADRLGTGEEPADLASVVRASAEPALGTLQIVVTADDPDRAELLADTFAEETIAFFDEQSRASYEAALARTNEALELQEGRVRELDEQLRDLSESSAEYDIVAAQRDSAVNQYRAAYEQFQSIAVDGPPTAGLETLQVATAIAERVDGGFPAPEGRGGRLAIGVGAALLVGIALALLVDRLDTRLRSRGDFEEIYGVPVLAEVPRVRRNRATSLLQLADADVASLQAHRALRTQLLLRMEHRARDNGSGGQVVVVTSAVAKEGKTTTAANLAATFAETGRSVLVVGADLQHRDIDDVLGATAADAAQGAAGLAEVLAGEATLEECLRETAVPGVRFLPGGRTTAPHRGLLDGAGALFAEAARRADVIVVDTAPVLLSSDAAELAVRADHVIVVGRVGRTTHAAAVRTAELLATLTAPAGVVVIGVPTPSAGRYGTYYADHGVVSGRRSRWDGETAAGGVNGHAVAGRADSTARFDRVPGFLLRGDGRHAILDPPNGVGHDLGFAELLVWRELELPRTRDEVRDAVEGRFVDADASAALDRLLELGAVRRLP